MVLQHSYVIGPYQVSDIFHCYCHITLSLFTEHNLTILSYILHLLLLFSFYFFNSKFRSYQSTLKQLFQEFETGVENESQLAIVTNRIMQALQSNLDGKSKQYKDSALTYLFLMNNIHYMVRSVRRY